MEPLETLYGELSEREISSLMLFLWPDNDGVTRINYTFERGSAPKLLQNFLEETHPNTNISNTTENVQQAIKVALNKWENACSHFIEFNYIEAPKEEFKGIIFQGCQFAESSFIRGSSTWPFDFSMAKVRGVMQSQMNMICVPIETNEVDLHTISHEICHAIGLAHLHDSPTIKQRLMTTKQGLGCSVMPYEYLIRSKEMNNACASPDVCLQAEHAVYPGPLDAKACSRMYDLTQVNVKRPVISIGERIKISLSKNRKSVSSSIGSGLMEGSCVGIVFAMKRCMKHYLLQHQWQPFYASALINSTYLLMVCSMNFLTKDSFSLVSQSASPLISTTSSMILFFMLMSDDFLREEKTLWLESRVQAGLKNVGLTVSLLFLFHQLYQKPIKTISAFAASDVSSQLVSYFFHKPEQASSSHASNNTSVCRAGSLYSIPQC